MKKIITLLLLLTCLVSEAQQWSVTFRVIQQENPLTPMPVYTKWKRGSSSSCTLSASGMNVYINNFPLDNSTPITCPGGHSMIMAADWVNLLGSFDQTLQLPQTRIVNFDPGQSGLKLVPNPNDSYCFAFNPSINGAGTTDKLIQFTAFTLSSESFDYNRISVYPNPSNSIVNIDLDTSLSGEIYSLSGTKVMEFSSNRVDISALSSGFYILKIVADDRRYMAKILKE